MAVSGPILVTGGAGFVGSHVVEALLDAGQDVRVLDLRDAPPELAGRGDWIRGDIRDPDVVARAVAGVGGVSHQAAMVGLGVDFVDVSDYVSHNDLGTAVLLRALAQRHFAGPIALAASMVVYGEGRYRCVADGDVRPQPRAVADLAEGRFEPRCPRCGAMLESGPISEDAPLDPRNVYAATKLQQEHLLAVFARETDGVTATALRYHNVYGPRMPRDTPYAGVASIFLSRLAAGEAPRVFEDGAQLRDFVHVRDVAKANVLALTAPVPVDGALNIASGSPRTVGQMARALWDGTGRTAPEPIITGEYRRGDVRHVVASPRRAAERLGFIADVAFEDGMRQLAV